MFAAPEPETHKIEETAEKQNEGSVQEAVWKAAAAICSRLDNLSVQLEWIKDSVDSLDMSNRISEQLEGIQASLDTLELGDGDAATGPFSDLNLNIEQLENLVSGEEDEDNE